MDEQAPAAGVAAPPTRSGLRRWGSVALAAAVLLALSQALWWWESWPVRQLLDSAPAPEARP